MKQIITIVAVIGWLFATVIASTLILPLLYVISEADDWFYYPANFWRKINQDL